MDIITTSLKQEGSKLLNTPEKTLYYLIIRNKQNTQMVVNVGQKTHDQVQALIAEEKQTSLKL